jgi:hypothetical protein
MEIRNPKHVAMKRAPLEGMHEDDHELHMIPPSKPTHIDEQFAAAEQARMRWEPNGDGFMNGVDSFNDQVRDMTDRTIKDVDRDLSMRFTLGGQKKVIKSITAPLPNFQAVQMGIDESLGNKGLASAEAKVESYGAQTYENQFLASRVPSHFGEPVGMFQAGVARDVYDKQLRFQNTSQPQASVCGQGASINPDALAHHPEGNVMFPDQES